MLFNPSLLVQEEVFANVLIAQEIISETFIIFMKMVSFYKVALSYFLIEKKQNGKT